MGQNLDSWVCAVRLTGTVWLMHFLAAAVATRAVRKVKVERIRTVCGTVLDQIMRADERLGSPLICTWKLSPTGAEPQVFGQEAGPT